MEPWFPAQKRSAYVIREYERASTTSANVYVAPLMARYLEDLERRLAGLGVPGQLYIMQSSGGIALPGPSASVSSSSATNPPTTSLWPPRYFVVLWTTRSAPSASGDWRYGVANVLSTARIAPTSWAASAAARMSTMFSSGFVGDSSQTIRRYPGGRYMGLFTMEQQFNGQWYAWNLPLPVKIFWRVAPTDMRKSFDGLHAIVQSEFRRDIRLGDVFLFLNRRLDRIKLLHWDRDGLAIWMKRLERGTFQRPRRSPHGEQVEMDATDLTLLLSGIELASVKRRPRYGYDSAQRTVPAPSGP